MSEQEDYMKALLEQLDRELTSGDLPEDQYLRLSGTVAEKDELACCYLADATGDRLAPTEG